MHATELTTIIKFLPTLLSRVLKTLITTVSGDVAIHSVRALLYFAWQASSIGKIDNLKAFIKYIFYVDYSSYFSGSTSAAKRSLRPTVHEELISNLVILIKQLMPMQDLVQICRVFKNCWFFLEIALKSLCLYSIQYRNHTAKLYINVSRNENNKSMTSNHHESMRVQRIELSRPEFESDFYNSLRSLYELLVELLVKYHKSALKDSDILSSYKCCNRSLAMFIKV